MKRRTFIKKGVSASFLTLVTPKGITEIFLPDNESELETGFATPPDAAKPQTWWHWMNGNVTKEGITLDLEAMKRVGIGGFQNFDAGTGIPKGPLEYLSPEWLTLKEHTIKESERLGLEFTMHNCPGWSSSGGPWITPELSMQQMTWSEVFVTGGKPVNLQLPKPLTNLDYYLDALILGFPSSPNENRSLNDLVSKVSTNAETIDIKKISGEDAKGIEVKPKERGQKAFLLFEFKQPYYAHSITLNTTSIGGGFGGGPLTLEASEDGTVFRRVSNINTADNLATISFPATKATFFRLVFGNARRFTKVSFSGAGRLSNWLPKANLTGFSGTSESSDILEKQDAINPTTIINLTEFVDKDGNLAWNAPAGDWTLLRIGHTATGTLNRSAPSTGIGLECDKYSDTAIEFHINKMMEQLLPTLSSLAAKGKVGLLIDSYEVGYQNWTPTFPQEFQKRKGYTLINYLPAMTGRIVGDVDTTERFLWDVRRVQADMMADNYYGKFHELCHKHNIISYTEPYDRGPFEEMQVGARVDVNMGEFWNGLSSIFQNNWTMRRTTKLAASISHINGKKIVGAEAFTGEPESSRWQEYPYAMKALGDKMFTQGLNRVIFHRYAHQPHPTALPGMTMGPWGIHFERNTTWWNPGKAWMTYLSRSQYLLQQGLFVADLAYFTGEESSGYAKVNPEELTPTPPQGYDYDLINAEVILKQARMQNGRLTLSDGMSYKVLVLQNYKAITLELARKLHDLVKQGLCLVGAKPQTTLGLIKDISNTLEFQSITQELWGDINGTTVNEHRLEKGRVIWGQSLQTLLESLLIAPDFQISSRSGDAPVTYIHRRIGDTEVYFLANQRRQIEELVCTFRVINKQPELWDASTGKITPIGIYEITNNKTLVPIQLDPAGSAFIIFRSKPLAKRLQAVLKDNQPLLQTKTFPKPSQKPQTTVANNFTISLWAKPENNISLTTFLIAGATEAWTDYYAIFPPSGKELFGEGHKTCGLAIGRNGIAVWEREAGKPEMTLAAPTALSGWSHIALVYQDGTPSIFVNGKFIQKGKPAGKSIHPGVGKAYLTDGASFYNGDMTEPQLFPEVLNEARLQQLAKQQPSIEPTFPIVEIAGSKKAELLFWQNGHYILRDNAGRNTPFQVTGLNKSTELEGPWQVNFPPDLGAPEQITLPTLISLHTHIETGVKYFSGTATYTKTISLEPNQLGANKYLFLDLGSVEVIAEVKVNEKDLGILWKRPYRIDITEAVKAGANNIEIKVTNLWPNRLIGDEQLPDENKYTPGAGASGIASLGSGGIEKLPEWFMQGKPKPADGRITFTTWKHYTKDSPLLQSGLIGPVTLLSAIQKSI